MGWEAWITLLVIALMVLAIARNLAAPDAIMLGGLAILATLGVFTDKLPDPAQAVAGFGNPGPITVGVLFVVAAGLSQTGALQRLTGPVLGSPAKPRRLAATQLRVAGPAALASAFMNNTPIVAVLIPLITDWCRKARISPSRLLIPLSYATILGGMCTLIGTSTNLVVNGLLVADPNQRSMNMSEIGMVGLPCAVVGLGYLLLAGRRLLPDRQPPVSLRDDPRQYTVEMVVQPGSPLVGQSVEAAGLRHLPGLYLIEIDRGGDLITAVGPEQVLRGDDRLVFAGVVESVVDLRKMRGLVPAAGQTFKLDAPEARRQLIEAVVSNTCPLVGKSIRAGRFRTRYDAAVIAVARNGQRIDRKIGDIVLQPGDTLLVEADRGFVRRQRSNRDFFLVSSVDDSTPPAHHRAPLALGVLAVMVVLVATGALPILAGALLGAGAMWLTRCVNTESARGAVDWQIILVIAAALGIGRAVQMSGAAGGIAGAVLDTVGDRPWLALAAIYVLTNLTTELITNNAAAVLVYPVAVAAADRLGVDLMPFAATIMIAASASFATPIGYQTNLMVMGPGGYRYSDYLRIGLPLNLLVMAVTVILAPLAWPMH